MTLVKDAIRHKRLVKLVKDVTHAKNVIQDAMLPATLVKDAILDAK